MSRRPAALEPVPFEEAIAYSQSREVKLPAAYYDELQTASKAEAFTVSNIGSLRQIEQVLATLDEVLAEGLLLADFQQMVATAGISLTDAHSETVFRTAVQTAYNQGRTVQQVAAKADRPYLMYDAINDSRTRPAHRAMDGYIAPVDDPIWLVWTPPCGFNCRCSLISLTEGQALARGFTGRVRAPDVRPDDGFDYNKRSRDGYQQRLDQVLSEGKAAMPPTIQRAAGDVLMRNARSK